MKYNDYLIHEIKQNLDVCSKTPLLDHHFYQTPLEPIIGDVGKVNYGESNYAVGPLTKTIFVDDVFGNRYKVSVEDLKKVKGKGWITHAEADKLDLIWNNEEKRYHVR